MHLWLRAVVSLLLVFAAAHHSSAAPPNIVLFVCDDLGTELGCYGNQAIKTPHLDALAAAGTRYTQAFCTTASCSASRSVILTGLFNHANAQYGHEHTYHHFRTYDNVQSLPVRLKGAGYRTARVGKLHVGPEEVYRFDQVLPGNARNPVQMANNCQAILAAKSDEPFFLYFCPADPHRSGDTVASIPEKPNAFGNKPQGYPGVEEVMYRPEDVLVPPFLPATATARAELAQYYQSVSRIDQGLGRLVALLKETGVYDETVILFTSDHGMAFPGAKTTAYEPGLRIPLVVRHPERKPAASPALVSTVDFVPTILDLAGALTKKVQGELHGRSFAATIGDTKATANDEIYASHTFHEITMYYPMRVVHTGRHKLIWNIAHGLPFPFASDLWEAPTWQTAYRQGKDAKYGQRTVAAYIQRPKFELYDLKTDPDETKNLADSPQHRQLLTDLQAKLKTFQQRTKDPWVSKWNYE